jgi:hypothetical protein
MKVVITESQASRLLLEYNRKDNVKPAVIFDNKYGMFLSKKYDLSPYNDDELWAEWIGCLWDEIGCDEIYHKLHIVEKAFPYYKTKNLDRDTKLDILLGMVSGYNPEDIINFSIKGIMYKDNIEQHELENKLPPKVADDLDWVLSPHSIKIIKERFGIE